MINKKILLICAQSQSVITFRKSLILALLNDGYDVSVIAFDDDYKEEIQNLGVVFYLVRNDNRSLNPFKIVSLITGIKNVIKVCNPAMVFTFMLKPNIFGVYAARKMGISNIYSMVEGVGDVFTRTGVKWKAIRAIVSSLYRRSFKNVNKVFFLNEDNLQEFIDEKIVQENKSIVIPGVGVDVDYFNYSNLQNNNIVLMIARLIKTKGIIEYCEAAKLLKTKHQNYQFLLIGAESELTKQNIKSYIDTNVIKYIPPVRDVRPYLKDCTIYVLPSYKEGLSMSIMEAEATGRAIITTDATGCRDSIINKYNGETVPVGDVESLAEKIEYFLSNPELIEEYGNNSRKLAERKFDQNNINKIIIDVLEEKKG